MMHIRPIFANFCILSLIFGCGIIRSRATVDSLDYSVSFSETSYSFSETRIGETSYQTLNITNTGSSIINPMKDLSTWNGSAFSYKGGSFPGEGGTCLQNTALNPSDSCTIVVSFSPSAETNYEQELKVGFKAQSYEISAKATIQGSGLECDDSGKTAFGYGEGTEENPFRICSVRQFLNLPDYLINANNQPNHFLLVDDLDFSEIPYSIENTFYPAGKDETSPFAGVFDGNGRTISNFKADCGETSDFKCKHRDFIGLFGWVSGTIKNLVVKNSEIIGINRTGLVVGYLTGRLENVRVLYSRVKGDFSKDDSDEGNYIGGLAGYGSETSQIVSSQFISSLDNEIDVSGRSDVGGIVGISYGILSFDSSEANIQSNKTVGGIVGSLRGTLSDSHAKGSVRASSKWAGGIAGEIETSSGEIKRCSFDGSVKAAYEYAGGLAGSCQKSVLSESFSKHTDADPEMNSIQGQTSVGGLMGYSSGCTIENSYSWSSVSGDEKVGGLIGDLNSYDNKPSKVINSYSKGKVVGDSNFSTGGLVGFKDSQSTVTNSVWDIETTGIRASSNSDLGKGLETIKMTAPYTFTDMLGWSSDIWYLPSSDYPILQWE